MAMYRNGIEVKETRPKKTRQGMSNLTKRGRKGGGPNGSTTSKSYKKRSRGQGR